MLPWFANSQFPLYLAPMAGVTDSVFRQLCKELGADVMVTEFVSAEGIMHCDARTRKYTEFTDEQRPIGVQLFGAHSKNLAEAAKKIIDWKQPEFIDLNFGCPVNKVVSKNGGSSLLKECPLLAKIAREVVNAVPIPVTAKMRIGWDQESINALEVTSILEDCGIQAIAVHGRTRSQGYRGEADWETINACAHNVNIPIIGNGDITSGEDLEHRMNTTAIQGAMIGRAAMVNPWFFQEAKYYLQHGKQAPPISLEKKWEFIRRHCQLALETGRYGDELHTMQAMRSRLMAYSRGMRGGKMLRARFSQIQSLMQLDTILEEYMHSIILQKEKAA